MTQETDELLSDARAVYGELHEYRNPEAMNVPDSQMAFGVLFRRELEMLRREMKDAQQRIYRLETRGQVE